jgi:hypothetical protein
MTEREPNSRTPAAQAWRNHLAHENLHCGRSARLHSCCPRRLVCRGRQRQISHFHGQTLQSDAASKETQEGLVRPTPQSDQRRSAELVDNALADLPTTTFPIWHRHNGAIAIQFGRYGWPANWSSARVANRPPGGRFRSATSSSGARASGLKAGQAQRSAPSR